MLCRKPACTKSFSFLGGHFQVPIWLAGQARFAGRHGVVEKPTKNRQRLDAMPGISQIVAPLQRQADHVLNTDAIPMSEMLLAASTMIRPMSSLLVCARQRSCLLDGVHSRKEIPSSNRARAISRQARIAKSTSEEFVKDAVDSSNSGSAIQPPVAFGATSYAPRCTACSSP